MTNSFSTNVKEKILFPGIILYENVLDITEEDIELCAAVYSYLNTDDQKYYTKNIKNTFFYGFEKINKKNFADKIQKSILHYLAKYCDIYDEAVHAIQWQENIFIDIEISGEEKFIYNTSRSFIDDNKQIRNTPFSRQIAVEVCIDDEYLGGSVEYQYINNIKNNKLSKGSILFYPSNYLFSKVHNSIIKGRKITLTTFFNGGKDFLAEENSLEDYENNLLLSYMR
jgi:hypothetical protein